MWVQIRKSKLSLSDKESLLTLGCPLTGKHINFAQVLFKEQYPSISDLMSTLPQYKPLTAKLPSGIQIIHCRDVHWVTAHKKIPVMMSWCMIQCLIHLMTLLLK